jgi:hypothetical protein
MNYQLRASDGSGETVENADLADQFAAERWALEWVRANGAQDSYLLKSADGRFAQTLFRTKSGQWYLTPAMELSAA